jgi:acyl carrier protein
MPRRRLNLVHSWIAHSSFHARTGREDLITREEIGKQITDFIKKDFLFDEESHIGMEESLLGSGTIDSTGVLELIAFVEQTYNLHIDDNELIAENFDTVGRISEFVFKRQIQKTAAS